MAFITVDVDVDVDISKHLDEVDTKELIEELSRRSDANSAAALGNGVTDLIEEALSDIREGRQDDAINTLERLLYPKFKSIAHCIETLAKREIVDA